MKVQNPWSVEMYAGYKPCINKKIKLVGKTSNLGYKPDIVHQS